jgi:D-lactate dehydrogenase (cytochrome)
VTETSTVSPSQLLLSSSLSNWKIAIILYNRKTDYEKTKHLVHDMVKRAIELEGTATGEHGVGLVKRDYLPHELGESTVDAMRQLKKAFDPLCLLNCDKIVRVTRPKLGEVAEW